MGRRDYRHRETKKPKKDAKKPTLTSSILPPAVETEIVRKPRKPREEKEEEEEEGE